MLSILYVYHKYIRYFLHSKLISVMAYYCNWSILLHCMYSLMYLKFGIFCMLKHYKSYKFLKLSFIDIYYVFISVGLVETKPYTLHTYNCNNVYMHSCVHLCNYKVCVLCEFRIHNTLGMFLYHTVMGLELLQIYIFFLNYL